MSTFVLDEFLRGLFQSDHFGKFTAINQFVSVENNVTGMVLEEVEIQIGNIYAKEITYRL